MLVRGIRYQDASACSSHRQLEMDSNQRTVDQCTCDYCGQQGHVRKRSWLETRRQLRPIPIRSESLRMDMKHRICRSGQCERSRLVVRYRLSRFPRMIDRCRLQLNA
ncbi:uncharacterized protein LOC134219679 [Armigeres subalbatus]|uniref:uncharacterized protein LOC134219679 n=1 Tax=Armigeres subalbatus TaxID=124917 RepID=UPI002ED19194